jgi:hypothetical protein
MATFKSTKLFDGYSTCFRQWRAEDTHCKYFMVMQYHLEFGLKVN